MSAVALRERRELPLRCAVCHDEPESLVRCEGCGSAFHEDCRRELARCPTLGCSARRIAALGCTPFPWAGAILTSSVTGFVLWCLIALCLWGSPAAQGSSLLATILAHFVLAPCAWLCRASARGSSAFTSLLLVEWIYALFAAGASLSLWVVFEPLGLLGAFIALCLVPVVAVRSVA